MPNIGPNGIELELASSGGTPSVDGYLCLNDITYANLVTAIANSTLEVGCYYRITDFRTTHNITNTADVYTGNINPIVLQAVATNKLSDIGDCGLYKGDTIYYNVENDGRLPGSTTGYIYRRIDNKLNINLPLDFKEVRYRRWAVNNTNPWNSATAYIIGDIVNHNTGNVYKAIKASTNQVPPAAGVFTGNTFWTWLGYANGDTVSTTNTGAVDPNVFTDYPIFDAVGFAAGNYANILSVDSPNAKTDIFYSALNIYDAFNNVFTTFCYFHNIHMSGYYVFTRNTFKGTADTYADASKFFHSTISSHSKVQDNYFWRLDLYDCVISGESDITGNTFVKYAIGNCFLHGQAKIINNTNSWGNSMNQVSITNGGQFNGNHLIYYERSEVTNDTRISNTQALSFERCFVHNSQIRNFNISAGFYNKVFTSVDINAPVSFSSILSSSYHVEIFSRQDLQPRMRYVNNSDVIVIAPIT